MDSQQAREILLCHRPGIDDASDLDLAEALGQAKRDPELAHWLEQQGALQKAIRSRFREIPLPAGLKERIMAERRIVRLPVWWKSPAFLAAAAGIVLIIGLASLWFMPREDHSFLAYQDRMVRNVLRNYTMDMVTNDLPQIRDYLQKNQAHGDYVLTPELEKLPGEGCAILRWNDRPVSLICFDAGNETDLFLFVIDRSDVPDAPAPPKAQFRKVNKLMTASWSAGNKAYVLAGPGDQQFLQRFAAMP
jgi:anti-sigma factor RsiW